MTALVRTTALVTALVGAGLAPGAAQAAFPGTDGLIAYVSLAENNCRNLHTVAASGTGDRVLTNCPDAIGDPAWNSAGNRLAVAMSANGGTSGPGSLDIYTMGPTGASVVRVTNDSVEDSDPYWSPSGSTIVEGRVATGPSTQNIAVVAASGGTPATLVAGSPGTEAGEPQFSPDGTAIAFQQRTGQVQDIYVMDADGSNKVDLTPDDAGNSEYPSWSPDGNYLAFASDRNGVFELFVLDVSGGPTNGQLFPISHESTVPDIHPTWSPDQKTLAFTHGCAYDLCSGPNGMENGDVDAIDVTHFAHPGTLRAVVAGPQPEFAPDWGVTCSSACTPPPPTKVDRSLTFRLKGQLKAVGELADPTGKHPRCAAHKKIKVQRRGGGTWHTLKTVRTGSTGGYSASIPNRSGTYRTRSPAVTLSTANLLCARVTSRTRTRALKIPRTIPYLYLGGFAGGIFANGQLKAADHAERCTFRAPVRIQKWSGSSWRTIATARGEHSGTNGVANFGVNVPNRNGDYRARAPRRELDSGDVCGRATSPPAHYPPSG